MQCNQKGKKLCESVKEKCTGKTDLWVRIAVREMAFFAHE